MKSIKSIQQKGIEKISNSKQLHYLCGYYHCRLAKEMERNLSDVTSLSPGEFASIFSESVAEDASGQYNAKLHFEIKTNDRN